MKLNSLVLHNYRKFKHAEIEFPEGIMAIVGNNGSGKSTIIEAMGWAIYGNKVSRTNREGIRRQGASPNDECWVKLTFELGGDVYEVTRIMSSSLSADASVKVNGLVAASSASGATRMLEKKIGMDYDAFFTSLVARQKEINALSSKTAGERKKSMLRMLGIDAVEDAVKKVREDRRQKESVVEAISGTLKDIEAIEAEAEGWREKLESTRTELRAVEGMIEALGKEVGAIEAERDEERKKMERYNELEREAGLVGERIKSKMAQMEEKRKEKEALEKKKERYGQIEHLGEEYLKVRAEKERMDGVREKYLSVKHLKERVAELEREIAEIDASVSSMREEIKGKEGAERAVREADARLKEIRERINEMRSSMRIKDVQIKASKERMEEAAEERRKIEQRGADSTCPTCGRPLKDRYGAIIEDFERKAEEERRKVESLEKEKRMLEKEAEALEREAEALEKRRAEAEAELEGMKKIERKIESAVESRKEKGAKMAEARGRIAEIGDVAFDERLYESYSRKLEELASVNSEITVLKSEIARLPDITSQISQLAEDLDMLEGRRKAVAREIENLGFDRKRYEDIEKRYEEKRAEVAAARENRVRLEGDAKRAEMEIKRLEREREEQKGAREKIRILRKEIQQLGMLAGDRDRGLLNDFKRYLISKIGPTLSRHASRFFSVFTAGKYSQMEIDENYDIYIYDDGERFAINRFSGGEEDLANLSLRLAISQVIAQRSGGIEFNFIVLDEIFGSQDSERRANVLNTLGGLSHQFRQVILITHIEEIKDGMQYVIRTFEDEEGISHVMVE